MCGERRVPLLDVEGRSPHRGPFFIVFCHRIKRKLVGESRSDDFIIGE